MKIMEEFPNQQFQVLHATESYEVGIHTPVQSYARVGCMRNMGVMFQELGKASHGKTDPLKDSYFSMKVKMTSVSQIGLKDAE